MALQRAPSTDRRGTGGAKGRRNDVANHREYASLDGRAGVNMLHGWTTPCTPPAFCRTRVRRHGTSRQWRRPAAIAQADALVPRTAAAVAAAAAVDDALSGRQLELDPAGYFLIAARHTDDVIVAQHYENTINAAGLACDPRTGEVIPCAGYLPPPPRVFTGTTAKQVCVAILESEAGAGCVSRLEHAAYLGRELQKAEHALRHGLPYTQD